MVRGNAKAEAQKKAQKKAEAMKKPGSQIEARQKALQVVCPICKAACTHYNKLKEHYDARHPKETVPPPEQFGSS